MSEQHVAGRLITFEGIEGCGKTTQIERLSRRLAVSDLPVVLTREPGGTELGRQLRALLLRPADPPMTPLAELLLYVTDRAQHLAQVVEPALARGSLVLCDRFLDATLAYQGYARGLGVEPILELHRRPPLDRRPDATVLIDAEPEPALARARRRNRQDGTDRTESRFEEEELAFHRAVRDAYRHLAARSQGRIRVVDGSGSLDEVEARVASSLADVLPPSAGVASS